MTDNPDVHFLRFPSQDDNAVKDKAEKQVTTPTPSPDDSDEGFATRTDAADQAPSPNFSLSVSPENAPHPDGTSRHRVTASLRRAILKTRSYLFELQQDDGHWCGELEGDTILESEYILLMAWLGRENETACQQAAEYLLKKQTPEGGWTQYPDGAHEISGSVKAYFALKLTGHPVDAEYMCRARRAILEMGGADQVNSYTRYYLALLGQIPYEICPVVPPELTLLPRWSPINLYRMSSWSRTIVVPMSIMWAHRPTRQLPPDVGIRELFHKEPQQWGPLKNPGNDAAPGFFSWDTFFRMGDRFVKMLERWSIRPARQYAIDKAQQWILKRCKKSDGLGAIFPPIIWTIVALKCLGYDDDSAEVCECHKQLRDLMLFNEKDDTMRLQPCRSPVWDTAFSLRTLSACGVRRDEPRLLQGLEWLLDHEVRDPGDWAKTVDSPPGGWYFEYNNEHYPDVDDTAVALMVLRDQFDRKECDPTLDKALPPELHLVTELRADSRKESMQRVDMLDKVTAAADRGRHWLMAMQNDDGGWGAFDRNNSSEFLCSVPFADHNAMIDPSCADITGRALEGLGSWGARQGQPHIDRAIEYLRREQQPDGSWFGRWGVNYIYGTSEALCGLERVCVPAGDRMIVDASDWLISRQQADGAWGESCDSYLDNHPRGHGPATASQTAWALLGLIAAGRAQHKSVVRGVRYLLETQRPDGGWDETEFTGTGFPRVFYLRYHYYPIYFPLMALSTYARAVGKLFEEADTAASHLSDVITID